MIIIRLVMIIHSHVVPSLVVEFMNEILERLEPWNVPFWRLLLHRQTSSLESKTLHICITKMSTAKSAAYLNNPIAVLSYLSKLHWSALGFNVLQCRFQFKHHFEIVKSRQKMTNQRPKMLHYPSIINHPICTTN